jgi:hypothetical protein
MSDTAAQHVPRKLNTTPTRQLLARAAEFELRVATLEHNQRILEYQQACHTWLLAEFLHNWRASIAAAYNARPGQ